MLNGSVANVILQRALLYRRCNAEYGMHRMQRRH